MINLEKVQEVITIYGLKNTTRKREMVWNRYAMFKFLRDNGFALTKIGSLVGKDHASVLNGLKIYEQNKRYSDFQSYVKDIESDLLLTFEDHVEKTDDICLNEMICLANLETLITEKL